MVKLYPLDVIKDVAHTETAGIGTLSERTLHAVLKTMITPDTSLHEQRVGSMIADVFDGEQVYEIQTRSLFPMAKKLERLLPLYPVTLVIPTVRRKTLRWLCPETGELAAPRRSPKTGHPAALLAGMYCLLPYLDDPHLRLWIIEMDVEEIRLLDGWSTDRKKGSHCLDRHPVEIGRTWEINGIAGLAALLPSELPSPFTAADFQRCCRLSPKKSGFCVNFLYKSNVIIRAGKNGRSFLYEINCQNG